MGNYTIIVTIREHLFAWKALEDTMAREEKSNVINRDMNKDEKFKALDAALTVTARICKTL